MPAVAAAANALITIEEYLQIRGITSAAQADDAIDAQRQRAINGMSQAVERHLGIKLITPAATIDEYFWGDGTPVYFSINNPIVISTAPVLAYYASAGAFTTMDTTTYPRRIDTSAGKIQLLDGAVFSKNLEYKLTYLYGYSAAAVPQDIKEAVAQLVFRTEIKLDPSPGNALEGVNSKSFGDSSTSYNLKSWPQDVIDILRPYRRVTIA